MNLKKYIPVNEPILNGKEKEYLIKCIESGWISAEGPLIKEFEEKYNTAKRDDIPILGSVIKSKTGRFQASNLPDHLRRLFEYFCSLLDIESPTQEDVNAFLMRGDVYFEQLAINMSTISGNVLEFPDSYWTQPEFGVVLKNSKNTMLQSLFKMPSSFPSDVFV